MERSQYLEKITKETPLKFCQYCGKKLERKRINGRLEDLSAFLRRKYCDRVCMKKAFVLKSPKTQGYSPAHHTARKIAYLIEQRKKICEICGSEKNIDVHHRDGNYHNNSSDNLMNVCRSCHLKLHRKPKDTCVICGKPTKGHGYCNKHYLRWKKYGNPLMCRGKIIESEN